ncbi:MAG: glycoside hydrolase family 2 TIM barrel-domain containing protein [Alistipes sp.]|nr:glycoside hydrolase family 2 TIM barrel-domain containing protein [Alistipes sp.]
MKRLFLLSLAVLSSISLWAQQATIYRSEFITYDQRKEAVADIRSNTKGYTLFAPTMLEQTQDEISWMQLLEIDSDSNDYNTFLHIENVAAAYILEINGVVVAEEQDLFTPADYMISSYLKQGSNQVVLRMMRPKYPELHAELSPIKSELFANSYFFVQRRISIRDFEICLKPDSTRSFAVLDMKIAVANDFNFEEPIAIGYDIYDPAGKLKEFNVKEITVEGHSVDTLHLHPYIYHANSFKWDGNKAPLYSLTLYIKRSGMLWEYIPMKIGFGKWEYRDGVLTRFDKEQKLRVAHYPAMADRKAAQEFIRSKKKAGYNTLRPDFPQPKWFYELCDAEGIFVIDQAAIHAITEDDRSVGGTPANDPALAEEFLKRVKKMYYRSRNHTCIVGFSLAGDASGNGYNMYKAYEWLKSVERQRPVFFWGNDGEWNSDECALEREL